MNLNNLRQAFFKYRSYTPIPLAVGILVYSKPDFSIMWFGFLVLLFGEFIRFSSVRYAGGATRTTKIGAPSLCTAGPYAHVRNPLYVGNMLMYTGIVFIAGSQNIWIMLGFTWAFFILQYSLIVSLEEETLEGLFSVDYLTYRQNVPSLIPRLRRWENTDTRTPLSFYKTLKTEKRTLQNVLLILILIFLRNYI